MATAFFFPTSATSGLPRVTPVGKVGYSMAQCCVMTAITGEQIGCVSTDNKKQSRGQCSRWIPVAAGAPSDLAESAKVGISKNGSKSTAYENRTKSAKCGGLETNGPRERIPASDRVSAVRRFSRKAHGYWASVHAHKAAENVVAEGLAEGEELPANPLRSWCDRSSTWERNCDTN